MQFGRKKPQCHHDSNGDKTPYFLTAFQQMIAKCPNKGRRDITILTKLRFLKFKALRDKCNKMIRHLTNDHFDITGTNL